jgi:hypothetical protein
MNALPGRILPLPFIHYTLKARVAAFLPQHPPLIEPNTTNGRAAAVKVSAARLSVTPAGVWSPVYRSELSSAGSNRPLVSHSVTSCRGG